VGKPPATSTGLLVLRSLPLAAGLLVSSAATDRTEFSGAK
jgi:hypothetical protein